MQILNVTTRYETKKTFSRKDNLETTTKMLSRYIARSLGDDRGYDHMYVSPIEVTDIGENFFVVDYTIKIDETLGEFFECNLVDSAEELAEKMSFIDYGDKTSFQIAKCRVKYM